MPPSFKLSTTFLLLCLSLSRLGLAIDASVGSTIVDLSLNSTDTTTSSSGYGNTISPQSSLYIVNKAISPDGQSRVAVLAGSTPHLASFPGPLIKAHKGDTFEMKVVDQLTNETMLTSTSIHWHGILQHHTAWADGPAFVTQCPITTGHSFTYKFSVPEVAGTYWYHSHLGVQYCDGLRGPLVIYDPNDPLQKLYDIDDETTIITLADWYHTPAPILAAQAPATQDSTLINGLGRWSGDPTAPLSVISVRRGKRYRIRLISLSCDPNYTFSIDSHNMTVIEADGVLTKPYTVDKIQIFAAQRYSFVLTASQPVANYWIRALPNNAKPDGLGVAGGINSAILRYVGAPEKEPASLSPPPTNGTLLAETAIHPLQDAAAPGTPGLGAPDVYPVSLELNFNFTNGRFLVNNVTYVNPTLPVLLQILSGKQSAQDLLPQGSVYILPRNKVIEVTIKGGGAVGGPHPFHLHGHTFSVVQSQGSTPNFKDPIRRDVTPVAAGQNTVIRFVTDNPGPWLLHCHIDFHLDAGLAIVFAEDPGHIKSANPVPAEWNDLCPTYNKSVYPNVS